MAEANASASTEQAGNGSQEMSPARTADSATGTLQARFVSNETRDGHTVYTISLSVNVSPPGSTPTSSWEIKRRYSDVFALNANIRRMRNAAELPHRLPSKTFFCGRLNQDFIDTRSVSLEIYLKGALAAELDRPLCGELSVPLWNFLFVSEQIPLMEEAWKQRVETAPDQLLVAKSGIVDGIYDLEKPDPQRSGELRFGFDGVPRIERGGYRRRGPKPVLLNYRMRSMRWVFCELPEAGAENLQEDAGKWLVRSGPAALDKQVHSIGDWDVLEGPTITSRSVPDNPTGWKSISSTIRVLPITPEAKCTAIVKKESGEVLKVEMRQATTIYELKQHLEAEWKVQALFQRLMCDGVFPSDTDILAGSVQEGESAEFTFTVEVWDANTRVLVSGARGTCRSLLNGTYAWDKDMTFKHERVDVSLVYEADSDDSSSGFWRVADDADIGHILLKSSHSEHSVCPSKVTEWSEWSSSKRYDDHGVSFTPELMMQQDGKWQNQPGIKVRMGRFKRHARNDDDEDEIAVA